MNINELEKLVREYNIAYRMGNAIVSDAEYDTMYDKLLELSPDNSFFKEVGFDLNDSRKDKLPFEMRSMNKIKTIEELKSWCSSKNINMNETVVITPKYDGLSFLVDERTKNAWTRGDGEYGQKSNIHYNLINNKLYTDIFPITYGEVIMHKNIFTNKYSTEFKNPRNLVAGLLNSKEATSPLSDCIYIKYGAINNNPDLKLKSNILDILNDNQEYKVPYELTQIKELTIEYLISLFKKWSEDFEIDGVIIEIDNLDRQEELGRETSTRNPCFARAFKSSSFEQIKETEVQNITWNISKQGLLKPVINITPVVLDGVTVSNITGNNAKYIKDMGIGKGSIINVRRSGMVIPIVDSVIKKVEFTYPDIECKWNDNNVELVTLYETDEQKIKKIISFFEILEVENVSEGIINKLWESGYRTIKDILSLSKKQLEKIDSFAERKAEVVYNNIHSKMINVKLEKLQHATGLFTNLGSKKLKLLKHFDKKPTFNEIIKIDGFSEISANAYLNAYDTFQDFIKELPITIEKKIDTEIDSSIKDLTFVFTGIRDKSAEEKIEEKGGKVGSGVSKKTNFLVVKEKGSGSSKELKAMDLGITVLTISELYELLS